MLGAVDAEVDLLVGTRTGTRTRTCISSSSNSNTCADADADAGTRHYVRHGLAEQELLQRARAAERTRQSWHLRVHSFTGYGP